MVRTGTQVSVGPRLGEGAQGVVHEAVFGGFPCVVKWYRSVPRPVELRRSITSLAERGRPHRAFIWPIDLVVSEELPGFGYVMPRLEATFVSFAQLLGRTEQPPFRAMITIGRHLVEAFEALHASGLCYRDISFGNLWVDTERGNVAIIDNDNVGVDGGDVFVWGTLRFMAPEVVRHDAVPSSVTDLYSLAVFLFYLFVHGHPLEGIRTETTFSWGPAQRESDSQLAVRYFGTEPVFVFDPHNDTNRPPPGDPMRTWWPIYPRFFRAVFEQAFTAGLLDTTGTSRVTEGVWRRALLRLGTASPSAPAGPRSSTTMVSCRYRAGTAVTSHRDRRCSSCQRAASCCPTVASSPRTTCAATATMRRSSRPSRRTRLARAGWCCATRARRPGRCGPTARASRWWTRAGGWLSAR